LTLVLDINVDKINFTLVSIYGPNDDNPQFYENIMSIVEEFVNEYFIICGDFNLVLCPELDYCNYLHVNNPKSREKVLELIEEILSGFKALLLFGSMTVFISAKCISYGQGT
jgi:hypothetical protein